MLDALAEWMGHPLHHAMHGGTPPARTGLAHAVIAPYDAYSTADGGQVLLSVQNDREWRRLAEQVLGAARVGRRPGVRDERGAGGGPGATDALVAKALGALDADEAVARLDGGGHRVRAADGTCTEVAEHPQLAATGPVAGGGLTGRAVAGAAAPDHAAGRGRRRGWVPCPRSGSTPRRCCVPWG